VAKAQIYLDNSMFFKTLLRKQHDVYDLFSTLPLVRNRSKFGNLANNI
jgi:hypothetical protein